MTKQNLNRNYINNYLEIGEVLKHIGIDVNFVPVADLSCNALDKHNRTYGLEPAQVIALNKESNSRISR